MEEFDAVKSQEDTMTRLAAEFDPRLADVWLSVFAAGVDLDSQIAALSCYLRMAYLRGYEDALTEPERGQLYTNLGLGVPDRPPTRTRRSKGAKR